MSSTIVFVLYAVGVSLTGVLSPGPMTAATLAAGTQNRHAGIVMALGHGLIEFPLMLLVLAGMGSFFQIESVKLTITLLGAAVLAFLGIQMLRDARKPLTLNAPPATRGTFATAVVMTAGNPTFLIWWATVGLALATQASQIGLIAFALFAVIHWLCDLVWLEILSLASHHGSRVFSEKSQKITLFICGLALLVFAIKFLFGAIPELFHP